MPEKTDSRTVSLQVTAILSETEKAETPKSAVYAFSKGGRLLARAPLDAQGKANLQLNVSQEAAAARVIVGPEVEEKEPAIDALLRRGAEERHLRIDPKVLELPVEFEIAKDVWLCWLRRCSVRGTLLKRVITGGVSVDLPVCHATVEVYEVDPLFLIIPKLPDYAIERLRDIVVGPNPPFHFPPPPPPPDPFRPFPQIGRSNPELPSQSGTLARRAEAQPGGLDMLRSLPAGGELQFLAKSASTQQFRQALIARPEIARLLICRFYPHFVTMQLVATAVTDDCGHFRTSFFRGCHNPDQPDLYFKARQRIFGFFDITIFAPTPIACHTFWNYVCGTEVTLHTTHPLAITCSPCPPVVAPNNWVLVMAIGNHPLSLIRGSSQVLAPTTNATNIGLTDTGAPFGGFLRLRLEFDNSLREDLSVLYYQVSWRKGMAGSFAPLASEVHRHYSHEVAGDLILEVYPLGPKTVPPAPAPNLFEIPPALPPTGQWSYPDLLEDLTNAKFPTNTHAPGLNPPGVTTDEAGKYQLKVELFHADGTPVDIAASGINWRVPTSTDLSGTILTADAATLGLVVGNSFIMTLHLDNNRCSAEIAAPTLNGTPASDECGVLEYVPPKATAGTVSMPFTAVHPNGFANYTFRVFRGAGELGAPALPSLPASGQAAPPGTFLNTQTVAALLGDCTIAGFSENLYVAATATDGWGRLSGYDAGDVRAFVLAPQPTP